MTATVAVATTRDDVLDTAVEHVAHQGRTVTLRQRGRFTWSVEVDGPLPRPLTPSERLVGKNRRLRRLLVDVEHYLTHPGLPERDLERRARLAARIREEVAE